MAQQRALPQDGTYYDSPPCRRSGLTNTTTASRPGSARGRAAAVSTQRAATVTTPPA